MCLKKYTICNIILPDFSAFIKKKFMRVLTREGCLLKTSNYYDVSKILKQDNNII